MCAYTWPGVYHDLRIVCDGNRSPLRMAMQTSFLPHPCSNSLFCLVRR